jgi:hypothetical protein
VTSMTDTIFIIAAVMALMAVAASIARYRLISIALALVGSGMIVLDRYGDFQHLWSGGQQLSSDDEAISTGLHSSHESTVAWSRLFINSAGVAQPGQPLNIATLSIMGTNVSDGDIKLGDAYFIGGVDGTKLNVQIGRGGARYKIGDLGPLPPGAVFFVVSEPIVPRDAGVSPGQFLKTWATLSFVARYNSTTQQLDFDQHAVEASLPKEVNH